jgi:hypothetical protein
MFQVLTKFHELSWVFICRIKIRGQFRSTEPHMVGTAGPTLPLYTGSHWVKSCEPIPKRPNSSRSCWITQTHHKRDALRPGGRAGCTCLTCPNVPPSLSHSMKHSCEQSLSKEQGRFDPEVEISHTWIDGPALNRRNRHQWVILDATPHRLCITRWFWRCARTYRTGRTYQQACQAKQTQGVDLQPPQEQWSGSFNSIGSGS